MFIRRKPNEVVRRSQPKLLRFFQNYKIIFSLTKCDSKTKSLALIAVEIPQHAMEKVRREELQRKAGSRLLMSWSVGEFESLRVDEFLRYAYLSNTKTLLLSDPTRLPKIINIDKITNRIDSKLILKSVNLQD
ncbi:hypothetical protein PQ459_05035 [Chryseobacterium sp. KACC 21268]|nr:hypothetical protein PQ459_05035 [Chryseobacterium sp. KACC 21268]